MSETPKCPCGSPVGPDFRYGMCDPCAHRTPASALLLMGGARAALSAAEKQLEDCANGHRSLKELHDARVAAEKREARLREAGEEVFRAAMAMFENLPEGAYEDAPYSSLALAVHELRKVLDAAPEKANG